MVATFQGKYAFPLDMLRRDMCWPFNTSDVHAIVDSLEVAGGREREVTVITNRPHFTDARWESFGWKRVM